MSMSGRVNLPSLYTSSPIKVKILILALSAILIPSGISIFLIFANYTAVNAFSGDVALYASINRLKASNEANITLLQNFLRSGALEDLAPYNNSIDTFISDLNEVELVESDLESLFLINSIRKSFESFYEEAHGAIRARLGEVNSPYTAYNRAERIGRYMDGYISMLMDRTLVFGTAIYNTRLERAAITRSTAIIVLGVVLILAIGYSVFVAEYLSTPIRRLSAAAGRMASGDLTVDPVPIVAKDEVGILTASFNAMNAHIADLVTNLKEKVRIEKKLHAQELRNEQNKKLLRESEFLALQARIQPHFLFNTLNSISRDILLRQGRDAGALVSSLSTLLRYSLEQGGGLSTLETELEIVRQYAFIQSYRFQDRIKVIIDCSIDNPRGIQLPAFTLQPLVENAFTHGLEPKLEGGKIVIDVNHNSKGIIITIQDDGIGINADRVKALMRHRDTSGVNQTSTIGLSNVRERLRLYTGDKRCFSLASEPEKGTRIELVLREYRV